MQLLPVISLLLESCVKYTIPAEIEAIKKPKMYPSLPLNKLEISNSFCFFADKAHAYKANNPFADEICIKLFFCSVGNAVGI